MSISVGDKYVIEIGAVAELPGGKKKYFIKPFESLVFDRKGLEQLEKFEKATGCIYQTGYADGYNKGVKDKVNELYTQEDLKAEYDKGFGDGYNKCLKSTIDSDYERIKKIGYDEALEDISNLMAFFNCNFMSECYPEEYKEDYSLYDLNAKYGLAEILEKWKAYKKQKQEIKNYNKVVNTLRTVTDEYPRETIISALSEFGIEVKE